MGSLSDIVSFQMMQPMQGSNVKALTPVRMPEPDAIPPSDANALSNKFQEGMANAKGAAPNNVAPAGPAAPATPTPAPTTMPVAPMPDASTAPPAPTQSDINSKTEIAPANKQVDQFFNQLGVHQYQYKDKKHGEGTHFSVMAQELEKAGPVGKSMVIETPEGKKVDYGRGLGIFLAGLTNHNDRIKELERLTRIKNKRK